MKTNLSVKIIGLVSALFLVLFSVISYVEFSNYTRDMTGAFIERAKATAQSLEAGIRNKEGLADKDMLMSTINKQMWLDPEIIDISFNVPSGKGLVTYVSNDQMSINKTADTENLASFSKDVLVSKLGAGRTSRILEIINPMHISGEPVGTFQIDFTFENIDNRIKSTLYTTILTYVAIMALFTISLFLILRQIVIKPVIEINKGLDAIAENNFNYRVKIRSHDEIGRLSQTFNQMTSDLKKSRAELEDYNKTLETQVAERTRKLKQKIDELEGFNKITIGRELKMVELKKRMVELEKKSNKKWKNSIRIKQKKVKGARRKAYYK